MVNKKQIKELTQEYENKINKFVNDFKKAIIDKIKDIFSQGVDTSEKMLNKDSDVKPSQQEVNIFNELVSENIKGVTDDMRREISNQLNMGISQQETLKQLRQRLDGILQGDNPTKLKYENRLKLILRTESSRIFNTGSYKTSKRLGAKYKYLIGTNDSRQGNDSKVALNKYGSPEKAIPIDDYFEFSEGGKQYKYKFPPNRPNDRETCLYIFEKPTKNKD